MKPNWIREWSVIYWYMAWYSKKQKRNVYFSIYDWLLYLTIAYDDQLAYFKDDPIHNCLWILCLISKYWDCLVYSVYLFESSAFQKMLFFLFIYSPFLYLIDFCYFISLDWMLAVFFFLEWSLMHLIKFLIVSFSLI